MSSEKEIAVITQLVQKKITINELCDCYDAIFQHLLHSKLKMQKVEDQWPIHQFMPELTQRIPFLSLTLNEVWKSNENYPLTPAILGDFFEMQTSEEMRIKGGKVFTPIKIANAMASLGLDKWIETHYHEWISLNELDQIGVKDKDPKIVWRELKSRFEAWMITPIEFPQEKLEIILTIGSNILNGVLQNCYIVDPCVGSGAFLLAICREIIHLFRVFYPYSWFQDKLHRQNLISLKQSPNIALKQMKSSDFEAFTLSLIGSLLQFLERSLTLIDLSSEALRICEIRIKSLLITAFELNSASVIPEILKIHINMIAGNALTQDWLCREQYPSFVIGNPPYISSDSMARNFSQTEIMSIKNAFRLVIKPGSKPDIFFYFIKKALDELQPNGILTFIIPNRILINDYAMNLRQLLFENTQILVLIDFSPENIVFQNANVHPCILILQKYDQNLKYAEITNDYSYLAAYLDKMPTSDRWEGPSFHVQTIPLSLAKHYNLLFSHLTPENIQILNILQKYPRLGDMITIREATRTARFQHFFPKDFPIHISREKYDEQSEPVQKSYIAECRGQDIHNYYIEFHSNFIALPELYQTRVDTISKPPKLLEIAQTPKILIRELGKQVFIAYQSGIPALLPYGGVYYFTSTDIHNVRVKPITYGIEAKMAYLASKVSLYLFSLLFHAGAWGDALKFRSSYLHQLPYIDRDLELMGVFGHQMYILSRLQYFISLHQPDSALIPQIKQNILWIEMHIDLLLIAHILSELLEPAIEISELEHFRDILSRNPLIFSELEKKLCIDKDLPNFSDRIPLLQSYLQSFQEIIQKITTNVAYQKIIEKIRLNSLYQIINKKPL